MPAPSQPELYNVRLWSAAATDLFQLIGVQAYRPSLAGMDFSSNSFLATGYVRIQWNHRRDTSMIHCFSSTNRAKVISDIAWRHLPSDCRNFCAEDLTGVF
ncbi:hypothetical protein L195_g001572 [Trifolium pratense]|uniref:Uncharacterized protein n=1 Tax=Trifolium pratense TaxID=57577 RepID=A0A2K3NQ22_TRIPR|nr:hypothetical protein L195_g001572 [Trifolium pratense]